MGKRGAWQRILCALLLASVLTCQANAVSTSAASAVLIEQSSGRVLYQQNPDEERLIASVTKIMTALAALEHGDKRQRYTVTAQDMAEGSSMYLKPGDTLELEELLYGLMLVSGNDAALAVAHCVSGELDDFVALMNETAEKLGLTHTHFANPNGLDAEGHYSSARDLAALAAYALENDDFRRIVSTASVTIGERYLANHNKLLRLYEGCIGVKTGFTKAAGRTLVSAAARDGMTLVCTTLNDGDDWNDHMALLDYGFANYHMETAVPAGRVLASALVADGTAHSIPLAAMEDLRYPLAEGETLKVVARVPVSVAAPVVPGQTIGEVCAYLEGEEVASVALVAVAPSARKEEPPAPKMWWDSFF
ncbi:MAG: D-alanyl-D-alanine carboxypeptidase [Oscillospiraceae bacterium]|nr:D-alanyl-D-alanine carboxypeptidase [Oscillospiraceae bacterium]